ncbi:AlbA family DNA-binding domain-containing protein [Nocardia gipuzkoensis]|uniref:AlbA family DNA-binding domain-containing protein n=1 Tax=Nocardia gipuzkoensis TaxID=2749991 RepID=UPI00237EB2D1|nr:ATP-binding protein [Nocardia gipuzkoensis]MDE1671000.1 ATP-binding protein [Nocardia gipuzkoensis]
MSKIRWQTSLVAAIWRNPNLEQLVGGSLDASGITEQGLRAIVKAFPAEAMQVEYKSHRNWDDEANTTTRKPARNKVNNKPTDEPPAEQPDDKFRDPKWSPLQERGKDVSAPANSRGALLIYGIENTGEINDRMRPFDSTNDRHKMIEQYRRDIRSCVFPALQFELFPVEAVTQEGFYLVAVIPPSPYAPHAVAGNSAPDKRPLYYFVRCEGESHIRSLAQHEVADLYSLRSRTLEERRMRVERVWADGETAVRDYSGDIWVAASIVPDVPVDAELTRAADQQIRDWDSEHGSFPDDVLGYFQSPPDRGIPGMGMLVFTQQERSDSGVSTRPSETYRELHADGSGYAAVCIRSYADDVSEPCDIDPDHLVSALIAAVQHLLDWTTSRAGRWGNATVKVGLIGDVAPNGEFRVHTRLASGTYRPGTRLVRRHPRAEVVAHLEEMESTQDRLVAAYQLASRILQYYGVLEPEWLTETGRIRITKVPDTYRRRAEAWVHRNLA